MEARNLEKYLQDGIIVDSKSAWCIIKENAKDGALFRTAAEKGLLNVIKLFSEAKESFDLSDKEKEMSMNNVAADVEGNTPIHFAARKGHAAVVEYLLSSGASVDVINKNIETPLHRAAQEGFKEVVLILLAHNAQYNIKSTMGYVALDYGVQKCHLDIVRVLLNAGSRSENALLLACEMGNEEMVRLMREHKLFFNYKKKKLCTSPLHLAAVNGHINVCNLLLENQDAVQGNEEELDTCAEGGYGDVSDLPECWLAPVDVVDSAGYCPLHLAAEKGHLAVARLLISRGANPNSIKHYRHGGKNCIRKPLHCAARGGHIEVVKFLIEAGAELDGCDDGCCTPLDIAVQNGRQQVGLFLQSLGQSVNKSNLLTHSIELNRPLAVLSSMAMIGNRNKDHYSSILKTAIGTGYIEMVQVLLQKGADANVGENEGMKPLHFACLGGSRSIVELLVKGGASVNAIDGLGTTPLYRTCSAKILEFLLEKGADPNVPNDDGKTALHANCGIEVASLLLKNNVLVDARDLKGNTPLHIQCQNGRADVADMLIKHGASVNSRNRSLLTPLAAALLAGKIGCAEVLLENDADLTATYENGQSLLHLVCSDGCIESTRFLLNKNVDVNAKDKVGNTALHVATEFQMYMIIPVLLPVPKRNVVAIDLIKAGAKINCENLNGRTPLLNALTWNDEKFIKFLIENGANPFHKNKFNFTPLEYAQLNRNQDIVSILEEYK